MKGCSPLDRCWLRGFFPTLLKYSIFHPCCLFWNFLMRIQCWLMIFYQTSLICRLNSVKTTLLCIRLWLGGIGWNTLMMLTTCCKCTPDCLHAGFPRAPGSVISRLLYPSSVSLKIFIFLRLCNVVLYSCPNAINNHFAIVYQELIGIQICYKLGVKRNRVKYFLDQLQSFNKDF